MASDAVDTIFKETYKLCFEIAIFTGTATQSAHDTNFFIILFERAFKIMKKGVYFTVIALLVAELFKILIYAN